ncbi:MAG: protein-L-isoaspartate(D-aspartate) O-methyltransferase [Sphingomonadales bacterium]|jgi:protein-L-isoaspartate(D-aspartate) O-methyltransferase
MVSSKANSTTRKEKIAALIMELRSLGVKDKQVLSAIEQVPREEFVPEALSHRAWENTALPIGRAQTISQPLVVALMTQALQLDKSQKVLEVGTGSGYQAAILAHLAKRVYTIERHAVLLKEAESRFAALELRNIITKLGNGFNGWPEVGPFPRILVTAAAEELPQPLLDQLEIGGRMVIPVGPVNGHQDIVLVERTDGGYTTTPMGPVRFVPLVDEGPLRN